MGWLFLLWLLFASYLSRGIVGLEDGFIVHHYSFV